MSNRPTASADPIVSVVVAAFNVEDYLDEALFSIRRQSLAAMEILIVDDGSTDATPAILARHASQDPRIRSLVGTGRGPGAARNVAMRQARGRWIAIVDGDDLVAPDRMARLVAEGEDHAVDAVADNMIAFYDSEKVADHAWIDAGSWPAARALTFADLMAGGLGQPPAPELGYLKPLLRRERLAELGGLYQEALMIGEDFDLMARWTAAGFSYRYVPDALYRYRRRASSLSYRLSADQIDQMIAALASLYVGGGEMEASLVARIQALKDLRLYARRVERLKRGDLTALAPLLVDHDYRRRLAGSFAEGMMRRLRARRQ